MKKFRAGFVMIMGNPNAGKSTLMNAFLGEKISIVSPKVQTTRHHIKGIVTENNYQIVFSDTPGLLLPKYELHKSMVEEINSALSDADLVIPVVSVFEKETEWTNHAELLQGVKKPKLFILNKVDYFKTEEELTEAINKWKVFFGIDELIAVSALKEINIDKLKERIVELLPEHPPYYTEDELTDKSQRFIVSEIVREKIFEQFREEIPYSSEVIVTDFKEAEDIIRIYSSIFVERESQKAILLGKGGSAIKKLGISAREECEKFLGKKIFLELTVKVKDNWRNDKLVLKQLGYK